MRIRRIRNYFCIMLLAILWLSACAKPDQEPYSVDECPLPNSDNIGDTDFFSMDIMPKGMISLLPDSFKQLAEQDSNDFMGLLTCSRYIEIMGSNYGGVSAIERTKDEYLNWRDNGDQMADGSHADGERSRSGWLVLSTSTWDEDEWYINLAHVCRWLVKPELNEFDENLYFSWLSGKLVDDSFEAFYGYSDRDGYHSEHLTWEDVPKDADSPWEYRGELEQLVNNTSEGKTVHVGQKHGKAPERSEETIAFIGRIRKKMADSQVLEIIKKSDPASNSLLPYGVKYVMRPSKNIGNYFSAIARSKNKISTALNYWDNTFDNNVKFIYTGKSAQSTISDDALDDQYHEEFVFHVISESLGRGPTVAEADLWVERLKNHDDGEAAGGDELLLECFGSDEFASRGLRPIQVINAIRFAANLDDFGGYSQRQWIQRLEEGLTAREAAEEIAHTDGFAHYCEGCHVRLSWQLSNEPS